MDNHRLRAALFAVLAAVAAGWLSAHTCGAAAPYAAPILFAAIIGLRRLPDLLASLMMLGVMGPSHGR